MQTPGTLASQQTQNPGLFDALKQHGRMHAGDVAAELAALRDEVAALTALLKPPSAVILTGAEVQRQFASLGCTCMSRSGPDYCTRHAA